MTMTLESISELLERGFIDAYDDPAQAKASIDAAIRERDRLRGDVDGLRDCAKRAEAELAALQARLDALMLEFCPDDMTDEQCAAWAARQKQAED